MGAFTRALAARNSDPAGRRWIFVAPDQLHERLGCVATTDPSELGIVLIESRHKAKRRPYHRQKLWFVLANQRYFALEQAARGVAIRYVATDDTYGEALEAEAEQLGPLTVMEPAEWELRHELRGPVSRGAVKVIPHDGWLTTTDQFDRAMKGLASWRMDSFYRMVRKETGILMEDGKPTGGKLSYDAENRKPWKGDPPAAPVLRFESDPIKDEVAELIERYFPDHPGTVDVSALPATKAEAEEQWEHSKTHCLPLFGPFEDAMSTGSRGLFHARISPLLNIHRVLPRQVLDDVLAMDLSLPSQEGFIRQVLGWREFVRHVHQATDGLRRLPDGTESPTNQRAGDGGYAGWTGTPFNKSLLRGGAGAAPKEEETIGVPPAYWGQPSGLACLDEVVTSVWEEAYSHHITRLMILSNLGTLLDVSPRDLTDWFWVAYADAYDWVVEPNVLGMGTFALGELMTTKPYISGAAYIAKMSDYCGQCVFHPMKNCPITSLYWAWIGRHRERVEGNMRMAMPLRSEAKRAVAQKRRDARVFDFVRNALEAGATLSPETLETVD